MTDLVGDEAADRDRFKPASPVRQSADRPRHGGGPNDVVGLALSVPVSDAGGRLEPDPPTHWARGLIRVLQIMDSQVRELRRRALVASFLDQSDPHRGFSSAAKTGARPYIRMDPRVTRRLASISTRLTSMPDEQQEMLINWGFAAADAGPLAHLDAGLPAAPLPYPNRPLI